MDTSGNWHLRNFIVVTVAAALLLAALAGFRSLHQSGAVAGMAGVLLLLTKVFAKLLPLLLAMTVELGLSADRRQCLARLLRWKRSRVVDLYAFVLSHLHKIVAMLGLVFTFGLPMLMDRLIRANIPEGFSLFGQLRELAGYPAAMLAFVLIATFFNYWEHRIWHSRVLWPIHRFHHSATEYNVLTETRKHFTETLLTPLFFTLPLALLGAPLEFVTGYLTLVLFQGFMNHTDQDISYGWIGRNLWCDPLYHKLHHSSAPEHMNRNFSGTLPMWDHLFGTHARSTPIAAVGVGDMPHYESMPFWRIYLEDLREFAANLFGLLQTLFRSRQASSCDAGPEGLQ